jgi:hypothetical protein
MEPDVPGVRDILLAAGVGAIPGAFFWGWMADRIGRRKVFIDGAQFLLATGIMAFTPDQYGWIFLSVCRFVVGIGVAGLIAVDLPLVQEFVPSSKRGWVGGLVTSTISIGGALGAACGAYLGPVIGWRGLFLIGLLPALLTLLIRAWVPESPRWLIRRGRREEARASIAWALQVDPADDRAAGQPCPRCPTPRGASCSIPAQRGACVLDGAVSDERRRACPVGADPAAAAAADDPGRGIVSDDLGWSFGLCRPRHLRLLSGLMGRRWSGITACFGAVCTLILAALSPTSSSERYRCSG